MGPALIAPPEQCHQSCGAFLVGKGGSGPVFVTVWVQRCQFYCSVACAEFLLFWGELAIIASLGTVAGFWNRNNHFAQYCFSPTHLALMTWNWPLQVCITFPLSDGETGCAAQTAEMQHQGNSYVSPQKEQRVLKLPNRCRLSSLLEAVRIFHVQLSLLLTGEDASHSAGLVLATTFHYLIAGALLDLPLRMSLNILIDGNRQSRPPRPP